MVNVFVLDVRCFYLSAALSASTLAVLWFSLKPSFTSTRPMPVPWTPSFVPLALPSRSSVAIVSDDITFPEPTQVWSFIFLNVTFSSLYKAEKRSEERYGSFFMSILFHLRRMCSMRPKACSMLREGRGLPSRLQVRQADMSA